MTEVPPGAGGVASPARRLRNGSGTTALVIGVVSLVLAILVIFAPLGAVLGVVGAIFGVIGLVRVNSGLADNQGYAIGGLVTSLAGLLIGTIITISVGSLLATHWNDFRTFGQCLDDATTDEARDACAQQFADAVD